LRQWPLGEPDAGKDHYVSNSIEYRVLSFGMLNPALSAEGGLMKKVFFSGFIGLLALAGCGAEDRVVANFQYSNAGNLGTQNAGLFEPGSMFLWDTAGNTLSFIDVLPLTPVGGSPAPADVASSNVSSIELKGIPVGNAEVLLRAQIGAQASFVAESAVREDYRNSITALADYVTEMKDQRNDPDLILRPRDPGFRIVVVRSVIRARSSELNIGGADVTDPNSLVTIRVGDGTKLSVKAGSSTSCARPEGTTGQLPACFFNVAVYDPRYLLNNPRMQFATVAASSDQLAQAFRSVR
jgi:hypothetical protein